MAVPTKHEQQQLDNALFKKLEQLTMKIPSDPSLYKEDVQKYSKMYQQQFQKLLNDIQRKNERFAQLLIFLSRCVKHFTKSLAYVPKQAIDLLKNHGPNLHPYVRKKCVSSIMILRAKNILYPVETIQFLLTLFNIEDKQLRKTLYKYILNDIRRMNKHHKNLKINQQLRKFIYQTIIKSSDKMTQKSLQLMIDLYKRNIWTDNRSVNIIAEGCFNQSPKIRMIAAHFLISTTQPLQELEESQQDQPVNPADIKIKKGITKHTKNKQKQVEKEKRRAARRLRKKQIQGRRQNFMPIDVIYNPQDFAQKLFNFMSKKNIKFLHKIVYMSLISRLIWRHKLNILPWYGSLIKYMQPKQKQVHKVLTYFAESVHENLPDDEIETVIKHIIQKFVNDRCSQFAMTIGLNTIREVYAKMNSLINEDNMLYLATYYDYKNKNVRMAAKALINLVRQINPYLLQKRFRGRNPSDPVDISKISKQNIKNSIDGAQLLDHKGQIPIYLDKIMTDQDFKQIRKLKRKQKEEQQWEMINNMEDESEQGQQEQQQIDDENQQSDQGEEQQEGQIDWGNCQQVQEEQIQSSDEQMQGDEQQGNQEFQQVDEQQEIEDEQQQGEQGSDNEEQNQQYQNQDQQQEQEQLQQQQSEQIQIKNKKVKNKNKANTLKQKRQNSQMQDQSNQIQNKSSNQNKKQTKNKKKDLQSSSQDYQEQSDPNPNGFLSVDQIAFYKKSKTQIKADRKRNPQSKQKFKHKPTNKKGGGTSNKQKQKLKPLLMLRAKKNKIRSQQKQVKLKIKNLKNQLGRVRSGKEAKKLKNKKITKQPKRR